jgi:integrase
MILVAPPDVTNKTNATAIIARLDLEKYNSCKIWLEEHKSPSTKKSYKIHLSLFCKFHNNIDPDTLIQLKPEQIKNMVLNYIIHLKTVAKQTAGKPKKGEISVNSIKIYMAGVQSFLESNEIILNWKKIAKYYPEEVSNDLRAYTKEEIAKLLSISDLRDRCLILLMVSTGIRVGAIKTLKIKHLKKLQQQENNNIGLLTVYPDSKNGRYNALLTPECMAVLDEYFEYRKKQLEKITDESFIIRDKYATFSRTTNRSKPLSERAINKQMKFLLRKAGLPYEQLQPDHSLRKFFNTALMNSDVAHSFKELLMGHSVKLDDIYYDKDNQSSRQKIVVEYMKAVDALTINEEHRLKRKVDELTIKTRDSDYIIKAKLQEKDEQVKTVTEQLNTMQSQMQALISTLGNMDEKNKNTFAKQLFQSGIYQTDKEKTD